MYEALKPIYLFPESRKLGEPWAAVWGSIKFDDVVDYILIEQDTKYVIQSGQLENSDIFARKKVIKLLLSNQTEKDLRDALEYFDDVLTEALKNQQIQRIVQCIQCEEEGSHGHFFASKKFLVEEKLQRCSNNVHKW